MIKKRKQLISVKQLWRIGFLLLLCYSFPSSLFAQPFISGNTYLDSTGYVEYLAGNLPIVISAPHGGYLEPAEIPDRDCNGCVYVRDSYTQELAREIQEAFVQVAGCYPHVVINLLHRKKFDANRDLGDAADGNSTVEQSWYAYHSFLEAAKMKINQEYDRGLFLDLHGHGHDIQRIELGYTLSKSELQLSDDDLNGNSYIEESSIQTLVGDNWQDLTHAELLRGHLSFGTMLEDEGFPAVPSLENPFPLDTEPYFSGGYNTHRHSSLDGGAIDGIQVECNADIRFDLVSRQAFADSITQVIIEYVNSHYNDQFKDNYCSLLTNDREVISDESLLIYPNPVLNQLQLRSDLEAIDLLIYNSVGSPIDKVKWDGSPLDVSHLAKGLYFLEFRNNGILLETKVLLKQ